MKGTEDVRKGWRIRPKKIRVRIGRPLTFPQVDSVSPQLATAVTDRIWPNVMLQWEWLGGLPPLRRAAVVGETPWADGITAALRRAKIDVDHVGIEPSDHSRHDLVAFAVSADELPAAVEAHAVKIAPRTGVLVASRGTVGGLQPVEYVRERVSAWAIGALGGDAALERRATVTVASDDVAFSRQVGAALSAAGLDVAKTALADLELAPPPETRAKAGAGRAA
jgi:glycerol-3-phosphate dehydrogenase (NAD(P)+)